jgi:putative hydrolase of the HAD superfamily
MVDWPIVSPVEGVVQTLSTLQGKYGLAVATNADDSGCQSVRAALARVSLDSFFENIFTTIELKARKPEVDFFTNISNLLSTPPSSLVMVGDDYITDIAGAWNADWRAIWYNPSGAACPGLMPIHFLEITRMDELPAALEKPTLPELQTCLTWMLRLGTSPNLMNHVQMVAAAAYQIAVWLRAVGLPVDPLLAHRGGLLHDLGKQASRRSRGMGKNHDQIAEEFLIAQNQLILAAIARKHSLFSITSTEQPPSTWEEKLVFFADKLVERGQIEPLEVRLAALAKRYTNDADKIFATEPILLDLQASLCDPLGLSPKQLIDRLRQAILEG